MVDTNAGHWIVIFIGVGELFWYLKKAVIPPELKYGVENDELNTWRKLSDLWVQSLVTCQETEEA